MSLVRTLRLLRLGTGVCASAALLVTAPAAAAPPAGDDQGSAEVPPAEVVAVERFELIAEGLGHEVVDPQCQRRTGDAAAHLCFARVGADPSDLLVIRTRQSAGTIDYSIIAEPRAADAAAPPSDPQPSGFDTLGYFVAMFSANPKEFDALAALTAPGSPAAAYLAFQREAAETAFELGIELPPAALYLTANGPRMCPTPESPCADFGDIVVRNGLVETFSVDGIPVAARLGVPGEAVRVGTTTFRVAAAYRTVSTDALAVYLEIDSTAPVALDLATATYIARDGSQTPIDVQASIGAVVLGTRAEVVTVMLVFDQADPGGTLRFTIFPDDRSPALAAHVPVDALVGSQA